MICDRCHLEHPATHFGRPWPAGSCPIVEQPVDARAVCPNGCGCRLGVDAYGEHDADRRDCACDGPCCFDDTAPCSFCGGPPDHGNDCEPASRGGTQPDAGDAVVLEEILDRLAMRRWPE